MTELMIRLTYVDVELRHCGKDLLAGTKRDARRVLRYLIEHAGKECYYPVIASALFADRPGNRADILKHAIMELRLQLGGYLQSDNAHRGKRIWTLADRLDSPTFCLQKTSQNVIRLSRCDIQIEVDSIRTPDTV